MNLNAQSTETRALAELVRRTHAENASAHRADEFLPGAAVWPADLSRRRFLQLMGASIALAGVGGCNRPPSKEIVPYAMPPEAGQGAEAIYYATAFAWEGYARGVLVAAHNGRPTKIEGNPQHPESLGATDIYTQASILSLYDPDRLRSPRLRGAPSSWEGFDRAWSERRAALINSRGRGLALLTEPTTSPTLLREIHALLDAFPEARWYQSTPLPRYDRGGVQLDYDFNQADVILSIESDVFGAHPAGIRHSRAFAGRRRVIDGNVNPPRLFAIESTPSITGSMADLRLPASPGRWEAILERLGSTLGVKLSSALSPQNETLSASAVDAKANELSEGEKHFVESLARDLRAKAPRVICVVDVTAPAAVQAWADALNRHFGAYGVTIQARPSVRSDGDQRAAGGIAELNAAIEQKSVTDLILVESNVVYTDSNADFSTRLRSVPFTTYLGSHYDETAASCTWALPQSHFLESWGDLRAYDGTVSIVQPLIEPLYESISAIEFIHRLSSQPQTSGYDLVQANWQQARPDFATNWRRWLDRGVLPDSAATFQSTTSFVPTLPDEPRIPTGSIVLVFKPDPTLADGRWANHGWLQELPKPFTHLVWDNAALVSPRFAKERNLENSDEVVIGAATGELRLPIWIVPGHADDCVTLHLGSGRTRVGSVGVGHGFDVYPLRPQRTRWLGSARTVEKTGRRHELVSTHSHFSMQSRDPVKTVALNQLAQVKPEEKEHASLYPKVAYTSYAWGMSIDLNTCTGCNACVIACQAENNIPVVGKEQVKQGREMHWIRIDRYYEGDPENPRILQQPIPCMHCENAPCELVCPVGATVHSSEGLNDMVYNRCVGTRYCSNNCPYKVRRFNFFDYRPPAESTVYLQDNPNVTVRERGVMEKCTYCVQRINAARIRAEREQRKIRDGEVIPACAQACPVEAIIFGDVNDSQSRVSQRKREHTDYALLGELNTRPRTTYLARVVDAPVPLAGGLS